MASARCTSTPSRVSGPAALLAPPASRYLAGKAAGLPRLLPICAQRTPSRQSPARRARRRLGRMTQPSTPEANKSLLAYRPVEPVRVRAGGAEQPVQRGGVEDLGDTGGTSAVALRGGNGGDGHGRASPSCERSGGGVAPAPACPG